MGNGPGGSAIIVYPNTGGIDSKPAVGESSEAAAAYRDSNQSSSENSSCSFSGAFGSTSNGALTSFEASLTGGEMEVAESQMLPTLMDANDGALPLNNEATLVQAPAMAPLQGPSNGPNLGKKQMEYQSEYKISDNVYKHAIRLEYTRNPLKYEMFGQDDERNLRKLNSLEENRLDEVNQHLRPLCSYVQGNRENKKFITDMAEGLNLFEHAIKRIIMAVKNIHSFKCMCQDDQIALLKGSAGEIKGLLNIRYFNPAQELCIVPNPSVSSGDGQTKATASKWAPKAPGRPRLARACASAIRGMRQIASITPFIGRLSLPPARTKIQFSSSIMVI